jgi:DNA-binding NtrC family response regulator
MLSSGTPAKPRILIADDLREVQEALRLLLKPEGFDTEVASSPAEIIASVAHGRLDVVLMDLNYTRDTTSGREGLDLLPRLQALDPNLPVVVMTAWATIDLAVEAMRLGARDFVTKPWDNVRLLQILRTQVDLHQALRRSELLQAENEVLRAAGGASLIAESEAMQPVLDLIARVGPSDANVLITGENGTGKGVVARALHAVSGRAGRPLMTVNTGGLSEALFESELFGHVRGAFTDAKSDRVGRFELADAGTLFLDEIANITLGQQAKHLRVLETGDYERLGSSVTRSADVRILSATNATLSEEIVAGRFRQDLLFRLNTVEIHLPPLRERLPDILPLATHFLTQHARHYRKSLRDFDEGARAALLSHPWPGNVRELDHAIERAALLSRGDRVRASDLVLRTPGGEAADSASGLRQLEELTLEEIEKHYFRAVIARCGGNIKKAAEETGLSRSALYRRIDKYGL